MHGGGIVVCSMLHRGVLLQRKVELRWHRTMAPSMVPDVVLCRVKRFPTWCSVVCENFARNGALGTSQASRNCVALTATATCWPGSPGKCAAALH